MKNVFVYPYSPYSKSARDLAKGLSIPLLRHQGSAFTPSQNKTIINWGAAAMHINAHPAVVLNPPKFVGGWSDKIKFFNAMDTHNKGASSNDLINIPRWTTDPQKALEWIKAGKDVMARKVTNGHSGEGIVFASDVDDYTEFFEAPLFVIYEKKKSEFRVHCFNGQVIDVQKKVLRKKDDDGNVINPENIDFRVRSHHNGFVFIRENIEVPEQVKVQAMRSFVRTGLLFAAMDVIWNESKQQATVLELNTAPGLEGTTLTNYVKAFEGFLGTNN